MAGFVNYSKRDVGLPGNCKDLMDVLRRVGPRGATPRLEDFEVIRDEIVAGPVSEAAVHVEAFCKFRGHFSELRITEPDDQIEVLFKKSIYSESALSISIPVVSPHQQGIRGFLKSRGLEWATDAEFPKPIYPAPAVQIFQGIAPAPSGVEELSRFVADFFLYVGLEGGSRLFYKHWMIAAKAR